MAATLVIRSNGDYLVEDVDLTDFSEFASDMVGGWTEGVPLFDEGVCFIVNELGKLDDLPLNAAATDLFWSLGGDPGDYLCGDVLVVGPPGDENVTTLPADRLAGLTQKLRSAGANEAR